MKRAESMLAPVLLHLACASAPAAVGPAAVPAPATPEEHARTVSELRPPRRARPVVAVVGENAGTETTDFLVPYAVLREADVAEVLAVAALPGPVKLHPALTVRPQATFAAFDARHPEGADYVIVPALHHADDPAVVGWIQSQRGRGATIVGVCSGAIVLSNAGLLEGRAATGHWYDVKGLLRRNPSMRWVRDRRYVADRGVVTTTGVTASIPFSLALVEAIGGRARAEAVARRLGVASWDEAHDSGAFHLGRAQVWTAARNTLAFWNRETLALEVHDGVDEVALAFTADAYSRTCRSRAVTAAPGRRPVRTRRGLELLPDRASPATETALPRVPEEEPARALDGALAGIARRYGRATAAFVALQLEYAWPESEP